MVINMPKVYGQNVKVVNKTAILICGSKQIKVKDLLKPIVRLDGVVVISETVLEAFSMVSGRQIRVSKDVIMIVK